MPGRSLTRPCPGTGTPSLVIERRGRRAFRYSARGLPVSTLERRGSSQPVSTLERFHARCRRHNLAANAARLQTRASRSQRHRVCRLLSELRPRLAQSSAERSDRPAAADGRVCWRASRDPRACARLRSRLSCLRHRPPSRDSACRRCLTPSLADASLHYATRSADFADASFRSAHSISETGGEPLREHGAAPDSLRSQRQSGGACPKPHTPHNAARTMRRQTAPQSLR